jgi:hypothetical protein
MKTDNNPILNNKNSLLMVQNSSRVSRLDAILLLSVNRAIRLYEQIL